MTRSLEDDARRRLEAADLALTEDAEEGSPQQGSEEESWEGTEQASSEGAEEEEELWEGAEEEPPESEPHAAQVDGWLRSRELRRTVRQLEQELARRRARRRVRLAFLTLSLSSVLAGVGWAAAAWESPDRTIRGVAICGGLAVVTALVVLSASRTPSDALRGTSAQLENQLESTRDELQVHGAFVFLTLRGRRHLYRESVADLIEQYRSESRRYRRVHNSLQVLVMIGSASSTTVAALDWGHQPTWQGITLTSVSFAITLASAFTGYYKYRERSYFLQQTADAIEEQANALILGIGDYAQFKGKEEAALARFTHNVERLRNEQRRRQQQLDQPAERADSGSQQSG
ncbi:DUF4231 domain-containing protein [Actinacidiphila glaucinigra]|uniref:DUF4231 domain-containing protein n=1 Tax=Actinacidiphila glaucinigra TaxID=235986 RepID=UPI0035E067E0